MTAKMQTARLNLGHITLSYSEWPGQKGPLICLPSLTAHKGSFAQLAAHLAPEYHLFALDLRGRGDSDQPSSGYGFAYHARDILAFAQAMGLTAFGLIGHSFGATVAVYLASVHPTTVKQTILLDGGADPKRDVLEMMRPLLKNLGKTYPSMAVYLERMQRLPFYQPWSAALNDYFRAEVHLLADGQVRPKSSAVGLEDDLEQHFHYCMCLHFPNLHCPTLFLHPTVGLLGGDKGHILTDIEVTNITRHIPHCQRVDVPGVNHYTMLLADKPAIIAPIRAFLRGKY